jgi:hypothetical protein
MVNFMQDGATAHIANYSIDVFNKEFEDRLINYRFWPARYPDLNVCDLYLRENLKNKVYSNNPQNRQTSAHNIKQLCISTPMNLN